MAAMQGAFRFTRAVRVVTKKTTGLVGIAVDPHGRMNLIAAQQKVLEAVKVLPADVVYRKSVEALATFRIAKAMEIEDEATLEKEIGYGAQLEELIDEAADEIHLISLYAKDKCWERSLDEAWRADIEADIKQGFAKEDAENAKTGFAKEGPENTKTA